MSQLTRIAKVLRQNNRGAGIAVSRLAKLAKVPRSAVSKRISDLRNVEGHTIYSNYRKVDGERTLFYRFAS